MSVYLVDKAGRDYQSFLMEAESLHTGGQLSVTNNIAKTYALIKVNNRKELKYNCIINIYNNSNHNEIFKFFYSPEWQEEI